MTGVAKYVGDLLKPLLTVLVTVIAGAFLLSVVWPAADIWIEGRVPAWARLDPAVELVRSWLGIHRPVEERPWWRF